MRKKDIIQLVSSETGVPKIDVLVVLETFFAEVKLSVAAGNRLDFRGFGSFSLVKRAAKKGRDIYSNTNIEIPASVAPVFKPAIEFKSDVRNVSAKLIADESTK